MMFVKVIYAFAHQDSALRTTLGFSWLTLSGLTRHTPKLTFTAGNLGKELVHCSGVSRGQPYSPGPCSEISTGLLLSTALPL